MNMDDIAIFAVSKPEDMPDVPVLQRRQSYVSNPRGRLHSFRNPLHESDPEFVVNASGLSICYLNPQTCYKTKRDENVPASPTRIPSGFSPSRQQRDSEKREEETRKVPKPLNLDEEDADNEEEEIKRTIIEPDTPKTPQIDNPFEATSMTNDIADFSLPGLGLVPPPNPSFNMPSLSPPAVLGNRPPPLTRNMTNASFSSTCTSLLTEAQTNKDLSGFAWDEELRSTEVSLRTLELISDMMKFHNEKPPRRSVQKGIRTLQPWFWPLTSSEWKTNHYSITKAVKDIKIFVTQQGILVEEEKQTIIEEEEDGQASPKKVTVTGGVPDYYYIKNIRLVWTLRIRDMYQSLISGIGTFSKNCRAVCQAMKEETADELAERVDQSPFQDFQAFEETPDRRMSRPFANTTRDTSLSTKDDMDMASAVRSPLLERYASPDPDDGIHIGTPKRRTPTHRHIRTEPVFPVKLSQSDFRSSVPETPAPPIKESNMEVENGNEEGRNNDENNEKEDEEQQKDLIIVFDQMQVHVRSEETNSSMIMKSKYCQMESRELGRISKKQVKGQFWTRFDDFCAYVSPTDVDVEAGITWIEADTAEHNKVLEETWLEVTNTSLDTKPPLIDEDVEEFEDNCEDPDNCEITIPSLKLLLDGYQFRQMLSVINLVLLAPPKQAEDELVLAAAEEGETVPQMRHMSSIKEKITSIDEKQQPKKFNKKFMKQKVISAIHHIPIVPKLKKCVKTVNYNIGSLAWTMTGVAGGLDQQFADVFLDEFVGEHTYNVDGSGQTRLSVQSLKVVDLHPPDVAVRQFKIPSGVIWGSVDEEQENVEEHMLDVRSVKEAPLYVEALDRKVDVYSLLQISIYPGLLYKLNVQISSQFNEKLSDYFFELPNQGDFSANDLLLGRRNRARTDSTGLGLGEVGETSSVASTPRDTEEGECDNDNINDDDGVISNSEGFSHLRNSSDDHSHSGSGLVNSSAVPSMDEEESAPRGLAALFLDPAAKLPQAVIVNTPSDEEEEKEEDNLEIDNILVSRKKLKHSQNEKHLKEAQQTCEHQYQPSTFVRPCVCGVCNSRIVGFGTEGFQCVLCKQTIHNKCRDAALRRVKELNGDQEEEWCYFKYVRLGDICLNVSARGFVINVSNLGANIKDISLHDKLYTWDQFFIKLKKTLTWRVVKLAPRLANRMILSGGGSKKKKKNEVGSLLGRRMSQVNVPNIMSPPQTSSNLIEEEDYDDSEDERIGMSTEQSEAAVEEELASGGSPLRIDPATASSVNEMSFAEFMSGSGDNIPHDTDTDNLRLEIDNRNRRRSSTVSTSSPHDESVESDQLDDFEQQQLQRQRSIEQMMIGSESSSLRTSDGEGGVPMGDVPMGDDWETIDDASGIPTAKPKKKGFKSKFSSVFRRGTKKSKPKKKKIIDDPADRANLLFSS
eukprot:TRINITY_DN3652_c0_g1_i1.p1 TRINITY_DN3652_c0_g1~~TRINITY_DN3652_c0_g1_i1.p1  ORF type:complete len:1523 (+),score=561.35 TRINITY_DN3652_c0_g1_i1:319-4569(+)